MDVNNVKFVRQMNFVS